MRCSTALRCLLLMLLAPCASLSAATIDHLEPASWWIGMRHHRVELMVHGAGIGSSTPKLARAGVAIVEVQRVANPNYLFVTVDIGIDARPGTFDIAFLDGDRVVATHPWRLDARDAGSAARRGFDASDAIYLLMPDRFANGDRRNDRVAGLHEAVDRNDVNGRHGGDIAGIARHLDYIAAMGFTQVWSTPLLENNGPKGTYHGYAITDLYRVDPRLGCNEDYRALARAARRRGVGLIMDVVLNHIGAGHWWMRDLPTPDWIHHGGTFAQTNHRRTTIQDPHAAAADRRDFVEGWFVRAMPDLDQRNPHLATYLIQNSLWWIEYAGLSGIREDTYSYADADFLSAWARAILDEYPDFSMVGEEWSANPAIVAHWQRGKVNPDGHVPWMPSMMDFPLHIALRSALDEAETEATGWGRLYEMLANDFLYPDPARLVVFAENHDTTRLLAQLDGDLARWKLAMVYIATMRGTPQFFYGSEVLLQGPRERNDGALRADMPGGWAGDVADAFSGRGLSPRARDTQAWLRTLLQWRKRTPAVQTGRLQHFAPREGVYVYFRSLGAQTVMVALNRNEAATPLALERFGEFIAAGSRGRDPLRGGEVALDPGTPLLLPAKSATILELEAPRPRP